MFPIDLTEVSSGLQHPHGALGLECLLRSQARGVAARGALFYPTEKEGQPRQAASWESQHPSALKNPSSFPETTDLSILQGRHILHGIQWKNNNKSSDLVQLTLKFEFFRLLHLMYNYVCILMY